MTYKKGSSCAVCSQAHLRIRFKFTLSTMQSLTLEDDRGTSWDRQYEPASLSNLPASVDLRSKFEDAEIEIYDQVHFSF